MGISNIIRYLLEVNLEQRYLSAHLLLVETVALNKEER